jgi:hypothetical protein
MLENSMTTPTLSYKQQQNIAQSPFFPLLQSWKQKSEQLKIDAAKHPVNEIKQNW